jgi:hypothetical protein
MIFRKLIEKIKSQNKWFVTIVEEIIMQKIVKLVLQLLILQLLEKFLNVLIVKMKATQQNFVYNKKNVHYVVYQGIMLKNAYLIKQFMIKEFA